MSNDFLNTVKDIEIPAYDQGSYDGPPRMYWHNGDRKAGTPGNFYIKTAELAGEEPGDPWQPVERFQGEPGYTAEKLRLAVIGYRQQAFRMDGETRVWLQEWVEGARIQTEALCFVQGLEAAPVVWVTKGLIGKALTGKGTGILAQYRDKLLSEAAKKAGKPLPLWTFWLPIQTALLSDKSIDYQTVPGYAKVVITPPAVHAGIANVDKAIESLFVGDQIYVRGAAIREEYDGWLKQRRGGAEPAEVVDDVGWDERGQAPAQRTPQAGAPAARPKVVLEEADLPF